MSVRLPMCTVFKRCISPYIESVLVKVSALAKPNTKWFVVVLTTVFLCIKLQCLVKGCLRCFDHVSQYVYVKPKTKDTLTAVYLNFNTYTRNIVYSIVFNSCYSFLQQI